MTKWSAIPTSSEAAQNFKSAGEGKKKIRKENPNNTEGYQEKTAKEVASWLGACQKAVSLLYIRSALPLLFFFFFSLCWVMAPVHDALHHSPRGAARLQWFTSCIRERATILHVYIFLYLYIYTHLFYVYSCILDTMARLKLMSFFACSAINNIIHHIAFW